MIIVDRYQEILRIKRLKEEPAMTVSLRANLVTTFLPPLAVSKSAEGAWQKTSFVCFWAWLEAPPSSPFWRRPLLSQFPGRHATTSEAGQRNHYRRITDCCLLSSQFILDYIGVTILKIPVTVRAQYRVVTVCPGEDLNLQGLLHTVLSRARIPIPPPGLVVLTLGITWPKSISLTQGA